MFKLIISIIFFCFAFVNSTSVPKNEEVKSGPLCQVCTLVLSQAQSLLEQNKSDEQIIELIEKQLCGRLGPLNSTCVQYIQAYGLTILYELGQKIDPSVICSHLGLCSAKSIPAPFQNEIKKEVKKLTSGPICEVCSVVLSAAQNLLEKNQSEESILQFLEKDLCDRLGSLGSTCVQYVEAYGKTILYELAQKVDPSVICNHLGLCQTMKVEQHKILKPLSNSLNCTLCKVVFQQVVNLLKNNASEAQILHIIENDLCNATGKFSDACKQIIDTFGPTILNYLANGVDPEKLCVLIGMCSSKSTLMSHIQKRDIFKQNQPKVKNTVYCTVCQYAMEFIDNEIKNNKTESAIVSALDKVCKIAPASLRDECNSLVNNYGIYLVQLLIQFGDPVKVCQAIKLC